MKKQPEQTARTRQTIIDAFWELALEQGLYNVTVSAVTKKARLNRGTFYVYFADMPELISQVEADIIRDYQRRMGDIISNGGFLDFGKMSEKISEIYADYDNQFFLLIGPNGDPMFRNMLQAEAIRNFRAFFPIPGIEESDYDYIMAYMTSALLGTMIYWHENGQKISVVELGKIIHTMATSGVLGFAKNDVGGNSAPGDAHPESTDC